MKKLICVSDVEQLVQEKKTECIITKETIITPAAIDFAEEAGIAFVEKSEVTQLLDDSLSLNGTTVEALMNLLMNKELLQVLSESLSENPFEAVHDKQSGLKVIKGSSIKTKPVTDDNGVRKQVLLKNEQKGTETGLLVLDSGCLEMVNNQEEINVVLSGPVIFTVDDRKYPAEEGDIITLPAGVQIKRSSECSARIVYFRS